MSFILLRRYKPTSKYVPKMLYESTRAYVRGYWPEPVTQQTLSKFLEDINYFEEPKQFINIGLDSKAFVKKPPSLRKNEPFVSASGNNSNNPESFDEKNIDELVSKLSTDVEPPPLNYDDARIKGRELGTLAVHAGIYRDLFGNHEPDREYIKFTPEQAERLDKLVPYHWITDQPKARVEHFPKQPEPIKYFEPIIDISARFVSNPASSPNVAETSSNLSYYGNIIPACGAQEKPSITLDGHVLNPDLSSPKTESQFNNWTPGKVELANFPDGHSHYHTVILLNLDSLHEKSSNLHWMLANIRPSSDGDVIYDEICDYLPVFGIRGFGFSRYVFLTLHHDKPLSTESNRVSDYSLDARKFDASIFLDKNQAAGLTPVGLSWFQTTWDISSNRVFHDYLKMKAPTYEHVQTTNLSRDKPFYPPKVAFNSFLDRCRTKKSINEQVLLERLKNVDPFDYKDQYVPPRVPPTVHQETGQPSWMHVVNLKKKNQMGYWRGLRPASALLPLDNNADLDHPTRPLESSSKVPPEFPNRFGVKRRQQLKDMPISLPPNEHQAVFVQEDHGVHLSKVAEMMKELMDEKSQSKTN